MRKKLEHLWLYDKWYLMAGAGVLLLLLNFWAQKARTPKPDYYVSIVTGNQISESTREGYAARLETVLDDRNGDGKVTVMVNLYRDDGRPGQAEELLRLSISMGAEDEYPANWLEGIGSRTEKDHRFRVRYNPWLFAMLAERELRPRPTVRRASTPTVRRKWPPSSKSWKTACPSTTTPWSRYWICAII